MGKPKLLRERRRDLQTAKSSNKNSLKTNSKKLTKLKIREITTVNKCLVWSCRIRTKKSENMSELVSDGSVPVIRNLNEFLEHFFKAHRDDNFLSIKYGNYNVKPDEAEGELIDWTMQYLSYMSCPASLEASLTRAVLDEAKSTYLSGSTFAVSIPNQDEDQIDASTPPATTSSTSHKPLTLLQSVTSTVNQVCKKLKMDEKTYKNVRHGRVLPTSVHAVKNGRRKMEDRHVQIHDLNAIFSDSQSIDDEPPMSFYGVYDGHAGKDAAAFQPPIYMVALLHPHTFQIILLKLLKRPLTELMSHF